MFYKVVRKRSDGKYGSAIVEESCVYHTVYEVGKWTKAPIGGLFVFNDVDMARVFAKGFSDSNEIKLFRCEVKNPKVVYDVSYRVTDGGIEEFWKCGSWSSMAPLYTFTCDEIKLTSEIDIK